VSFAIRTANAPETLASAVRGAINEVDRELPVYDVRTMGQWETRSLTSRRSAVLLSSGFGAVALLLSVIGIYGMLAYLVAQRTKEIGIRVVLGSSAPKVFALILREGALLIAGGLLLGGLGAMVLRKVLEPQLFGISATDPVVLCSAMALLALVALAACLVPAGRAVKVDPMLALRQE
jgi:ABC-type antimicrobial peptide transport system permease subunit